jgi:DNA-binding transcriptional ArsR family regulator
VSDIPKRTDKNHEGITFNSSGRSNEILSAISNTQRRRILSYVQEEGPTSQNEVAHQLAAWKQDSPPDEVADEVVEKVKVDLYHKHLPKLKDAQLIEYDERSEKLLVRNLPELAEINLNHCAAADIPS